MEENKLQISIYKILESFDEKAVKDILVGKKYKVQKLKKSIYGNYELFLYYQITPVKKAKWKDFISDIAVESEGITKELRNNNEKFVLLFINSVSNNIYATTGGMGFQAIQDIIEDDFGVGLLSRLISKDDKIIKSVKEKNVIGGILGSSKYFRKDYNLYENDSFGSIYQELKAQFSSNILKTYFGFSGDEIKKDINTIAKSSFKINKSINFNQILKIIKGCEKIYDDVPEALFDINSVEKIINKKNQKLIAKLEKELYYQLWQRYSDNNAFDFDICNKDYEAYLTASTYKVRKNSSIKDYTTFDGELANIDKLFEEIKDKEDSISEDEFSEIIKSLKILSFDEDGEQLTKGYLINHIFGDVDVENQKYFFIDKNWYRIKNSFTEELDKSLESFICKNYNDNLTKKWNYGKGNDSENTYNSIYFNEGKTLVLDKVTPENIEPCDILKWDDNNLYFHHVKAGFGNTMRDLCSQVFIAANRIKIDINSDKSFISEIYSHIVKKKESDDPYFNKVGKQADNISEKKFIELFDKNIIFVLSVLDTATERNLKDNISDFNSSIAKFSLQELIQGMKGIDIDFQITQIFQNK